LTNSIKGMRIAGMALAAAMCAAATQASAQMRVFMGPGGNNNQAPGSAGLGTAGLGLGGFGSATENLREPDPTSGSNQGLSNALGVTGGAGVGSGSTSQGSLSSAIDHPSSPINSVTNSLMGSVGTPGTTIPALKPPAKRKPGTKAAAASSNGGGAAAATKETVAKETPAKTP
jgi:hypothetical protein